MGNSSMRLLGIGMSEELARTVELREGEIEEVRIGARADEWEVGREGGREED